MRRVILPSGQMQSAPHERAIDLNDLTVWEEELNK